MMDIDDLEDSTFERHLSPVARLLAAHDLPCSSDVFLQTLSSEINRQDISKMKETQQQMLQRFEKTNEMLLNFNSLSSSRYDATAKDFKHHTNLLADMKKDLNQVFKRIRALKDQLSKRYPDAFKACEPTRTLSEEDEDESQAAGTSSETLVPIEERAEENTTPQVNSSQLQSSMNTNNPGVSVPSINVSEDSTDNKT